MRKKLIDDKFYMPSQIDIGSAEKDVTEPTETPYPLAKGSDGLPKFNQLQDAQKRNMPKAMRSQVAFQQKKLQYSNYQIINFGITPTDSIASQAYYNNSYNGATAVGTALDTGVLFGTSTADVTRAKYYNIVYANCVYSSTIGTDAPFLHSPSYMQFYLMQKIDTGAFGGKIPRQIEAIVDQTDVSVLNVSGTTFGVQSFGIDVYNENAYYTQTPNLMGMRACGVALKEIQLNFSEAIGINNISLQVELAIDLKTEGNNY